MGIPDHGGGALTDVAAGAVGIGGAGSRGRGGGGAAAPATALDSAGAGLATRTAVSGAATDAGPGNPSGRKRIAASAANPKA